jgi:hypothetical protein
VGIEEILVMPLLHPREDPEVTADCLTGVTLNIKGNKLSVISDSYSPIKMNESALFQTTR